MFDYVIVGAGSAGCVLANRLSADPATRVLLLEAGGRDSKLEFRVPAAFTKLFRTPFDWNYTTEAQPGLGGRRLYWPRGKVLGGSSSINAQMWVRGHPADYDAWAAAGNRGWGYRDVLPYFRRAEDTQRGESEHAGVGGPVTVSDLRETNPLTHAFLEACEQAGIGRTRLINAGGLEGVDYTQVTQRKGARCSSADAYLRPALRRPNLSVEVDAHAERVTFEGGRAVGVDYRQGGVARHVGAAREVILAGGAINSPQLLLLSGVGPADELRAHGIGVVVDSPAVGENLVDHLLVAVIRSTPEAISLAAAESAKQVLKYLFSRRGMLSSNVGEAHAFVRVGPGAELPDIELIFAPVPYIDHGAAPPPGHGMSIGIVLLQPESKGRIRLRSGDPFAPPSIDPRYLAEPADLARLIAGVRRALEVYRSPALASRLGGWLEPTAEPAGDDDIAALVREQAETLYHPAGTCRMGPEGASVVDDELKVRGVRGLRVVDASVMPSLNRGHTHAPVIMIAEKAADLLRRPA